ncbi:MAG: glycosyltransferase [Desulfobacula sp.]|jgi:starch synthase|uniref:glycogen synthase n=1 Tax=Desulfobacula sp. TaxID=2593537 RepID=UPI001D65FBAA|nr:glycosyltransferase [Desulfobacula sp.]MBT3483897.1 glycosyltransferase [Desulfobacula sp.]MBT3803086.1 glycosyltransferase [Desulfobacula sp.]MBT4023402.1 glycosyltransferase [Desulfobacula sp.]MBT4197134.1 glycosyltransferase [Desulfobacula sp.]
MTQKPRILIVTPEVTYLPEDMGEGTNYCAKAGGLADVSAALISALFELGCDVHVALPDYRSIYNDYSTKTHDPELNKIRKSLDDERIHLAADRAFYYLDNVYSGYSDKDLKVSLAFQREVINNIIPRVNPDIIHCNDWMTGLIPAMARQIGTPCLFTIHNIHTMTSTIAEIEDRGIDAASFWKWLFFKKPPHNYEESRDWNRVDFLTSGIFAAHYVNTVSPQFLKEIVENRHMFVENCLKNELSNKYYEGCATGILNAPEPEFNPAVDDKIRFNYGPKNHRKQKIENKLYLQKILDLEQDENAPLFFWPSRLDPVQKGCQLLAQILYEIVSQYHDTGLQVVFVASGPYQKHFHDIVQFHGLHRRVAVCGFNEALSHQAFASSDFLFMPSSFEPCGLPQMVGCIYGTLPIVFDTGGLHDTISDLDVKDNSGNGFLFNVHDAQGLKWGVERAMDFYLLPREIKEQQIKRIMIEGVLEFNHSRCAESYISLYEKMLKRPFLV